MSERVSKEMLEHYDEATANEWLDVCRDQARGAETPRNYEYWSDQSISLVTKGADPDFGNSDGMPGFEVKEWVRDWDAKGGKIGS